MTAPTRSRASLRARLVAVATGRVVLLVVLVIGSGVLAGLALAYPLRQLELGGAGPVTLDHLALVGEFDPTDALVRLEDLPDDWAPTPPEVSSSISLVGAPYCGQTVEVNGQLGEPLRAVFSDSQNGRLVLSEVVRVRRQADAGLYVNELAQVLSGCENQRFFAPNASGERVQFQIRDDSSSAPVNDYVSRTLSQVGGASERVITYFQVGDVIVAVQYAGLPNPPRSLMAGIVDEILSRVAPEQFSKTAVIPGNKPLPTESTTTTTIVDPAAPSPTSSPTIIVPVTPAPNPTFEAPTTTRPRRRAATTTTVAGG